MTNKQCNKYHKQLWMKIAELDDETISNSSIFEIKTNAQKTWGLPYFTSSNLCQQYNCPECPLFKLENRECYKEGGIFTRFENAHIANDYEEFKILALRIAHCVDFIEEEK